MNHNVALQTERLILEPLANHHAPALFEVFSNLEAMRFWHAPPHRSEQETQAYLDALISGPECAWVVKRKTQRKAQGLVYYLLGTAPVGMGYIVHPELWGQGIAREATSKILEHGFNAMELDRIELWIDSANARSLALADRLGFVRRGAFVRTYAHREGSYEIVVLGLHAGEDKTHPHVSADQFYCCVPVVPVNSVSQTIAFYRDKLGFELGFAYGEPPAVARVHRSDWSGPGTRIQFQAATSAPTPGLLSLYFEVGPALDALFEQYRARGVAIEKAPETMPYGMREFAISDCNGLLLRFATPV